MKIGIGLPTHIRDMDAAVIPQWATRAEEAGFSTLATLGRIAYPGVMDTVALAGAAASTQTIALSSNVMLSTVWPAPLLAKELAGIDAMSKGRLTLGLGIGGDRPDDFVADGLPPRGLGKRMDSDLETFQRVWRSEPVGGGVNAAVPTATRQIPLLFGGMAPRSFARMAKWGQGMSPEHCRHRASSPCTNRPGRHGARPTERGNRGWWRSPTSSSAMPSAAERAFATTTRR